MLLRRIAGRRTVISILSTMLLSATLLVDPGWVMRSDDSLTPQSFGIFDVITASQELVQGPSAGAHLGGNGTSNDFSALFRSRPIAIGDVNGDGIPDVAIGAPDSTVSVTSGTSTVTRAQAGAVYVFFGGPTFTGILDTNQANIKILGANAGDRTGFSVAIGDVNGDGVDDIVIGAPFFSANTTTRTNTGAVFVVFGAHGLPATTTKDLATANTADVSILGIATGDSLGSSVAVGNAGGSSSTSAADQQVKDILIGAPNASPGSRTGAGEAFLVFGGSRLNRTGGVTTVFDLSLPATPPDVEIFGKAPGDTLGASVALGNINGGTLDTLIAGAPTASRPVAGSIPAVSSCGAVYGFVGGTNLIPGSSLPKVFDVAGEQQSLSVYGAGAGDRAGYSVAVGDVNGDGSEDLVIGAPQASIIPNSTARAAAGHAYVIAGGSRLNPPSGLGDRRIDVLTALTTPNDPSNLINLTVLGADAGDQLGQTVNTGNYNAGTFSDTIPDVLIGAPGANSGAGAVSIIMGGPTVFAVNFRDALLGQDDFRVTGRVGFNLGIAVAAADLNHDNAGDLLVASPFVDVATPTTRAGGGTVYVLNGTVPTTSPNIAVTLTSPVGTETLQVGQPFTIAWTASDPNGNNQLSRFQLLLSTNGGSAFSFIIANNLPGTSRNFVWTVPTGVNTTHGRIQVMAFDNLGATGQSENAADFTITDTGIPVSLLTPNGTESLKFGQTFNITWSVAPASQPMVKGFDLFLSTDAGVTFPTKLISGSDPSQPALSASATSFAWTVPSICTSTARIAVIATSLTGVRTQASDTSSFTISDIGPTIDTTRMSIDTDLGRLVFFVTTPQSGTAVDFSAQTLVEISTDQTGSQFATFSKTPKVKASGTKLIVRGLVNGEHIPDFFPDQSVRFIRFTNPTCAVTLLKVMRNGTQLVLSQ